MNNTSVIRPGFAVIDVETTGFSATNDRIVELAVVVIDPAGVEVDAFCTVLDPGCDPGPTHVHGITAAMVKGAPTFGHVHPFVAELLSGRVIVGHNVGGFDLGFLRAECHRYGGDRLMVGEVPILDTLTVARTRMGLCGKAKLVDCCDYFGLTWDDHHSALGRRPGHRRAVHGHGRQARAPKRWRSRNCWPGPRGRVAGGDVRPPFRPRSSVLRVLGRCRLRG